MLATFLKMKTKPKFKKIRLRCETQRKKRQKRRTNEKKRLRFKSLLSLKIRFLSGKNCKKKKINRRIKRTLNDEKQPNYYP